jgi:hypothetical protein
MTTSTVICSLSAIVAVFTMGSCGGSRPIQQGADCSSIQVNSGIVGPVENTTTLCVLPTQCREDAMGGLVAKGLCSGVANNCSQGDKSCAINQLCKVTAKDDVIVTKVTYDRDSPCEQPPGTFKCTAKWKIPAGSGLHCACACAQ